MKQEIQKYLATEDIYFYWKGRVALYAILKAMGVKKGDEIIIPAFTCVVVPNAIKYLGATPKYLDIEKDSLGISLSSVKSAISDKTKAIICQNTLGLSHQVEEISAFAQSKGIYTIEDCTHGFGGSFKGRPNGSYCDAAFFSTQWNKPFSTGIGGFGIINNSSIKPSLEEVNKHLIQPSLKETLILSALLVVREYLITPSTYWMLIKLYRWLSKMNLVVGSSQGEEISSVQMPQGFFKGISKVQMKHGAKSILKMQELLSLRKENAKVYTQFLKENGKYYVNEEFHVNHSFLKYPILVKNREAFLLKAEKAKIELGEWFNSPIHPVQYNHELWDLNIDDYPTAKHLSSLMVNLPTDIKDNAKVLLFIKEHIDDLV